MTKFRKYWMIVAAIVMTTSVIWGTPPRYTMIVQERVGGRFVVEPIYTPLLTLTPMNAVAAGTAKGDALNCEASVEGTDIYLTCDESRFLLTGFSLQE